MDRAALIAIAASVRRMTTNRDIVALCDGVQEMLAVRIEPAIPKQGGTRFDKVAYQREYMKRWRAKKNL